MFRYHLFAFRVEGFLGNSFEPGVFRRARGGQDRPCRLAHVGKAYPIRVADELPDALPFELRMDEMPFLARCGDPDAETSQGRITNVPRLPLLALVP